MPQNADATPDHVDETTDAIAQMHAEHQHRATGAERMFACITATLAAPLFIVAATSVVVAWIGANLLMPLWGLRPFDPLPFDLLQGIATLVALYATVLILATQRRDDEIATRREQLALQLAMLNDRKLAKLIALIEELRRDNPSVPDRIDAEAETMADPSDARAVLDALDNV